MSLRGHMPTLVAGLLALASLWLVMQLRPAAIIPTPDTGGPDYYLGAFSLVSMGAQGLPQNRIEGKGMQHLPAMAETRIEQPRLTLYRNDQTQWVAYSDRGVLSDDGEHLLLGGKVIIEDREPGGALRLQTRDLNIQPQTGRGETDQAVTLTTTNGQIHAIGLRADLAQQQLQLLSNVRGRYAP